MNYSRNFHAQSSIINNRYVFLISGYGKVKKNCIFMCPKDNFRVCDKPELYDAVRNKFIKLPKVSFQIEQFARLIKDRGNNLIVLGYFSGVYEHIFFNSRTLTFDSAYKVFDPDFNILKTLAWGNKINDNKYLVQFTNGTHQNCIF